MRHLRTLPLVVGIVLGVAGAGLAAEAIIYEPFDYPAGQIDGTQAGGIGLATNGWTTEAFTRNPYAVHTVGLTFTNLPTVGLSVARPSAPDNAEMHRPVSETARGSLLADGSTIWFSVLIRDRTYAGRYENQVMLLSSGPLTSPATKPVSLLGGEGIGVALDGNSDNTMDVHAIIIDDGVSTLSTGLVADTIAGENVTYLIAGKITWATNSGPDTVRLFNISDADADEPADTNAFAELSADLDQSVFNTLALGSQQISIVDEIRFADTFDVVMGRETPRVPDAILLQVR